MSNKPLRMLVFLLMMTLYSTNIALSQEIEQPNLVVIPGTIQSVLGCDGDWQPDCEVTALTFDEEDQLWSGTFELPAGDYEYKVAIDGSWDVNYGLNAEPNGANIPLSLAEDTSVRFIYNHNTHWVTENVNSIIANVPGSYQSEIGCADDWQPWCLQTLLQDTDGDGIYTYSTTAIPAGAYEAKVAFNESWDLNYGEGGAQNGANIGFTVPEGGTETVFSFDTATNVMTISVGGETAPAVGNLFLAKAIWVTEDTIAWNIGRIPGATYQLHYSNSAELSLIDTGVEGGLSIELTYDRSDLPEDVLERNPQLADYFALKIAAEDLELVPEILRGQIAISQTYGSEATLGDATGVQIWGVLDDLYAENAMNAPLGVVYEGDVPTLHLWAPTAHRVFLDLFDGADTPVTDGTLYDMTFDPETGIWSFTGDPSWTGKYYVYELTVYSPSEQGLVYNAVTDPYSLSLSMNSTRSQIVNLNDPALIPEGWEELEKPPLDAFEDIVLCELHVRDFSIIDEAVSPENRGTFRAFTESDSNGMQHLRALAEAGLTHIHLLPAFDIATINENAVDRQEPDRETLAALPPDSEEQQAMIEPLRDLDGFNWGYDPFHYTVPEGSYSTDPNSAQRILEFREMVQALNQNGLRVVMDVVYNHTNSAGQGERSVLDRIVPGYYHRLNAEGRVETSTCCPNTATEHLMMERLMIDSLMTWATEYRVDGFRFDLMGHHMRDNMLHVREALDSLTLEDHGVDGTEIYIYGEGWNFGEVADNARGVNATQLNMAGTGIGTFSDRLRDAVRGGNPFGGWQEQGFSNGLFTDPNEVETLSNDEQRALLLHFSDQIRVGLAGNLANYPLENAEGEMVTGADIDYNGQPAGYTFDPQENIVYISAHDNETFFDAIQLKAALTASIEERVRMQNLGLSIVALAQGVPFFHAGDDILRSKSTDRNSYNSGDWFNALDWTYQSNNWGHGLPPAGDNSDRWDIMQPLLANESLQAGNDQIVFANTVFREWLQIRRSSPLFRLHTADDIIQRLQFHNTGVEQIPGVIVMSISDDVGENLDSNYAMIVVVFNATDEQQSLPIDLAGEAAFTLHPTQQQSADSVVQSASFDGGAFTVPARTTAAFVLPE